MPKITHQTITPGALASRANLEASVALGVDTDTYPAEVVNNLRQANVSLSKELATLRKTLKIVLDSLKITVEDFESYNTAAEEAKKKAKEQEEPEE